MHLALADDERCAEIADAAEEMDRIAKSAEHDFQRDCVARDWRDPIGLRLAEHGWPLRDRHLRITRYADVGGDAIPTFLRG